MRNAIVKISRKAFLLLTVVSAVQLTGRIFKNIRTSAVNDGAVIYESLLSDFKATIKPHEKIGFTDDRKGQEKFYWSQYALAPTLIKPGTGYALILADFDDPGELEKIKKIAGLKTFRKISAGRELLTP